MKNSKKTLSVLLVLLMGAMLFGCVSANVGTTQGYATTIEEAHPDRLEKTYIGMDVDEFKAIWPEASRSGIGDNSETYEFAYANLALNQSPFYGGNVYNYKIITYFYFTNNKLEKYESQQRTF